MVGGAIRHERLLPLGRLSGADRGGEPKLEAECGLVGIGGGESGKTARWISGPAAPPPEVGTFRGTSMSIAI